MIRQLKNIAHLFEALLANIYYGFPARKLFVIGVTGTDGKTTTASLIYHILKSSGKKVALISSVAAYIGNEIVDTGFHTTTPTAFALQKNIRKAVDASMNYLVLEVTSHALDQNRAAFILFEISVFTNVSHEHLDYHKTYDRYLQAKTKLLEESKVVILNKDDISYERIKKYESRIMGKKVLTYGLEDPADYTPETFPFETRLLGDFNRLNCLAAIGVVREVRVEEEEIREALKTFTPPPGRQEVVYDKDFRVIIDFAHTPNAFEHLLPVVKGTTKGRLIHVFGAAGLRDVTKRPLMGEASAKYADIIVLTAEDPRTEPVEGINQQIASGIMKYEIRSMNETQDLQNNKRYLFMNSDRKQAIMFALSLAMKGDTVLLTGKGHEKSMNYGKGEEPWDERRVAEDAIKKTLNDTNS